MNSLIKVLKESVGDNGKVIMPAFSYSFCKKEKFDIETSKSTVGVLTEFFRKQNDVERTIHPIFSSSIWGKNKENLINLSKSKF